ncbi:hypothetical protein JCM8547_007427 [Rhodosporidiobolus lusitaniae]
MECTEENKSRCHLLRLPTELLDEVFELAYGDKANPTQPLYKALLPSFRRILYRRVEVSSYSQVALFRRTLKRDDRLGQLVKQHSMDFEGEHSTEAPSACKFRAFLRLLPQLRHVSLIEAEPPLLHDVLGVFNLLLTPHACQSSPRCLLNCHSPSRPVGLCTPPHQRRLLGAGALLNRALFSEPHFALVHVYGRPSGELAGVAAFLLTAPTPLKKLILRNPSYNPHEVDPELLLDHVLSRLSSLTSLTFGLGTPVSNDLRLSLVDEPTRHPSLKRLVLDYVECRRGLMLKAEGYVLSTEAEWTDGNVYPGWQEPEWNDFCDEDGLRRVIWAARRSEIELSGTALDAVAGRTFLAASASDAEEMYGSDIVCEYLSFFDEDLRDELYPEEKEESDEEGNGDD